MKFSKTQHATSEQLVQLLDEQLSSKQELLLISHIDQCEECQARLDRLAEDGKAWPSIQRHLLGAGDVETRDESSVRRFLELLEPIDDPEMLGRLERYEVSAVIGAGSTGIVARAYERTLNRFVAIKALHPTLCDSGPARKRFDREGRAIAAVVNPHVVPVFAIAEHRQHPFIVMQYMPGGSLQQRIDRDGQLSAEAVARLGLHIAEGLEAAHAQGITHRDVKPANVMLESGSDRAMVSDFGLARVNHEASMTCSGLITGTPQYMSPEQARGEVLDGRSDLFSLGSTLYAACTGHPPFRAENIFGVIKRVCEEDPRPILEHNPKTPDWLVAFIAVLMNKDKGARFQSAAEVSRHLSAELAHMQAPSTVSRPLRPWDRPVSQSKRPTSKFWFSAAASVGLLALLADMLVAKPAPLTLQGPEIGSAGHQQDEEHDQAAVQEAINRLVLEEGAPLETFEFVREQSVAVQDGGNLVLRSDLAEVTVQTHDKPQVEVEAVISIGATSRRQAEALMGEHEFGMELLDDEIVQGRDAKVISQWRSVECDLSRFSTDALKQFLTKDNRLSICRVFDNNSRCGIRLRIKVPKHFNLQVLNRTGDVSLPDIHGDIKTAISDGNVTLGDTRGHLDISVEDGFILGGNVTGNAIIRGEDGNITLGIVGGSVSITSEDADVEVDTAGRLATVSLEDGQIRIGRARGGARLTVEEDGEIRLGDVAEEIQASIDEGTITVERLGRINKDSVISTKEGAIRISVESATSVDIEARSDRGRIRGSLAPEGKTRTADIQLNGGGPTLKLRSTDSSIHLDEVAAKAGDTIGG